MENEVATESINWVAVLFNVLAAVGGTALVATQTPNKSTNKIVQAILNLINVVAGNWGKSKNDLAEPTPKKKEG